MSLTAAAIRHTSRTRTPLGAVVTLTIQNHYAKRKWQNERVPRAEIR